MMPLFLLAWRNLFRNARRTFAALATVALGATGLLIYQGFNTGIMNQYRENTVRGYYGYGQVFPVGYYGKVHEKPWEKWFSDPLAIEQKIRTSPAVIDVYPRVSFYAFLTHRNINLGGMGEGILPERENGFFTEMNFVDGGNLEAEDELIMGKGLADSLGVKAGDTVTVLTQTVHGQLNGADLRVAGISHMGIKAIDDKFFRLHLRAAQSLLDTRSVESFALQTKGVAFWDEVAGVINQPDSPAEALPFDVLDKVYYQNSVDFLAQQFSFIRSILLFIVGLGIFNTIASGLLERSGEIGALRANGERRSRLAKILLIENAVLGLLGGIIGGVIAFVVVKTLLSPGIPMPPAPGITRSYTIFIEMQFSHFLGALVLTSLTATFASAFPIRKLLGRKIPELLRSP